MPYHIRDATQNDISLLTHLIRESFHDVADRFNLTPENCPTHPSNCKEEWIKSALEKGIMYYILENDDEPYGCVALERAQEDTCYLERLAVLPKYRGIGHGKLLVKHALQKAKEFELQRVEIGIIAEHHELKEWYIKLGFSIKQEARFNHLPFTVLFMYVEI